MDDKQRNIKIEAQEGKPPSRRGGGGGRGRGGRGRGGRGSGGRNSSPNVDDTTAASVGSTAGEAAVRRSDSDSRGNRFRKNGSKVESNSRRSGGQSEVKNEIRDSDNNSAFDPHWKLEDCLLRYNNKDPNIIRGVLRVLPTRDGAAFCTCDRGLQKRDVLIGTPRERNRALHGDTVFVELLPEELEAEIAPMEGSAEPKEASDTSNEGHEVGDNINESWWQDDPVQMGLWAPTVAIKRKDGISKSEGGSRNASVKQRKGRVVYVIPPSPLASEINPTKSTPSECRNVVGVLKRLQGGTTLLTCVNKSLPQFRCSQRDSEKFKSSPPDSIFQAKYRYGSWKEDFKWPPCVDLEQMGRACNVEDETRALLIENQVDHGEFPASVLQDCHNVVESGEFSNGTEWGWKPTPDMYKGRRDYRQKRIFTIDPTTAKDLPFGGYKGSGIGREGLLCSMDNFLETKSVMIKTS